MITSFSNTHIKEIKHLKERKYRGELGLYYIEGIRIVFEAVSQPIEINEILISPELARSESIEDIRVKASFKGIPITELSKEVFESVSSKDGPQGVAAVVKQDWTTLSEISQKSGVWVALYEIADPGNLGTILRTCDGVGANGIILIGNCTDPFDPTAVRASMGALFSKILVKTGIEEFSNWIISNGKVLIGTSDHANVDYRTIKYTSDAILLMGSERQGIPPELEKNCKNIVSIPMAGSCDSLNLAVATSILLYEVNRNLPEEGKK